MWFNTVIRGSERGLVLEALGTTDAQQRTAHVWSMFHPDYVHPSQCLYGEGVSVRLPHDLLDRGYVASDCLLLACPNCGRSVPMHDCTFAVGDTFKKMNIVCTCVRHRVTGTIDMSTVDATIRLCGRVDSFTLISLLVQSVRATQMNRNNVLREIHKLTREKAIVL